MRTKTPEARALQVLDAAGVKLCRLCHNRIAAAVPGAPLRALQARGRPRVQVDRLRVADLRAEGFSLRQIAAELGCTLTTVARAARAITPAPPASKSAE